MPPLSAPIRWGILGAGDVADRKAGPAFYQTEGSVLTAVMRRTASAAEAFAHRHGAARFHTDADALIDDPEVDAVYVATWPDTHAAYTIQALEAGKPVYVEKPMARTVAEAEAMVAASERTGVPLFVAYYRRAQPRFLKIKELLDEGTLGAVRSVSVRMIRYEDVEAPYAEGDLPWRLRTAHAGGGFFYDLASHQLDLLDFLLGPIAEARGFAANRAGLYPPPDTHAAALRFERGALGTVYCAYTASPLQREDQVVFTGATGRLSFSVFGGEPILLEREGRAPETFPIGKPPVAEAPMIAQVVGVLLGRGKASSTGASGLRTQRVLAALAGEWKP